jgi:rare lipoprotein A
VLLLLLSSQSFGQITEIGLASFYADKYDGKITASGEVFDQTKMTAAHRTFPFGTKVKVINLKNKKSVEVVINDRGPFVKDRVIDLTKSAADVLGFVSKGTTMVKVEVVSLGKTNKTKGNEIVTVVKNDKKKVVEKEKSVSNKKSVEYYKITSQKIVPKGFGIQIASYKDGANLMKQYSYMKQNITKDIIVKISENDNGDKIYRVIIGTFTTKKMAIEYNNKLKQYFSGSFIIAF